MPLAAAQRLNAEAEIGDFITDPLPPIDFGRIAAQTAKQVIVQKVRDAERQRQYAEFKDRVGEIVNGLVKRVEFGNVVVDLGRAEAMLRRDELLPRESFRQGERVRAYVYDVRPETRGPQIFLSRTHPAIHGQAVRAGGAGDLRRHHRDQVGRARSRQPRQDRGASRATAASTRSAPASACAAAACRPSSASCRAKRSTSSRGRPTRRRLSSTRWPRPRSARSSWTRSSAASRSSSPTISCSLAIGRRGQNVRLASQLTGWDIDILTEAEESERRTEEFRSRSQMFIDALDIDDVIAHLLVTEGFGSLEEVAYRRDRGSGRDRGLRRGDRRRASGARALCPRTARPRVRGALSPARRRGRSGRRSKA